MVGDKKVLEELRAMMSELRKGLMLIMDRSVRLKSIHFEEGAHGHVMHRANLIDYALVSLEIQRRINNDEVELLDIPEEVIVPRLMKEAMDVVDSVYTYHMPNYLNMDAVQKDSISYDSGKYNTKMIGKKATTYVYETPAMRDFISDYDESEDYGYVEEPAPRKRFRGRQDPAPYVSAYDDYGYDEYDSHMVPDDPEPEPEPEPELAPNQRKNDLTGKIMTLPDNKHEWDWDNQGNCIGIKPKKGWSEKAQDGFQNALGGVVKGTGMAMGAMYQTSAAYGQMANMPQQMQQAQQAGMAAGQQQSAQQYQQYQQPPPQQQQQYQPVPQQYNNQPQAPPPQPDYQPPPEQYRMAPNTNTASSTVQEGGSG